MMIVYSLRLTRFLTKHLNKSEHRAAAAVQWVEKEIDKLIVEIQGIGRKNGNQVEITFGELFTHYQDVSDTLVGILQRAKKRSIVKYEGTGGDLLLQRKHDNVVITLDLSKADAWRKEYLASGGKPVEPQPRTSKPVAQPVLSKPISVAKPPIQPTQTSKPASRPVVSSKTAQAVPAPVQAKSSKVAPTTQVAKKDDKIPAPVIYCLAISVVFIVLSILLFVVRKILF